MSRQKLFAIGLTQVLWLGLVASSIAIGSAPAVAQAANDAADTYVVEQGDRCVELTDVGDGSQSVEEYYGYNEDGTYSSTGTESLQETETSQLFVYRGSEGVTLVFLHDRRGDGEGGGAVTMEMTGLPSDGEWAVQDDYYGNTTDDNWEVGATSSTVDWMWAPNRTDGGAYRGLEHLGDGDRITIDPAFGEESYAAQEEDWPWAGNTSDWAARSDDGLVSLDMSASTTVGPGTCQGSPPAADLTASPNPVSEGEPVTLDASGSSDDGTIVEYQWDLDGDGSPEETTSEATIERTFDDDTTVTVTVQDEDNQNSTASVDLAVEDNTPPVALASANASTVTVGDPIEFDASDSYDDESSVAYEWDFADGANATGPTVVHAYDAAGQYNATVTVTDEAGNQNRTTVPIEVTEPGPTAALDAPDAVGIGEAVTLDASGSTDDVAEYRWTVDGETNTTTTSTLTRQFDEPGTVEASVTVADEQGRTDSASTTIQVRDAETPLAVVDGPNETVVGEAVTLDGRNSSDNAGVTSYEWTFGDGTTATGPVVDHAYDEPGEYTVTLNVTDDAGNYDLANHTVAVEPDPAPTADLVAPAETGVGTTVSLDASGSSDPGGITTYRWDLDGDGTFDNETDSPANAVSFNETGAHTVAVEVVGQDGQRDVAEVTIEVVDAPPTVALTGVDSATAGESVTLSADVDDDRGVDRIEWDLGDGTTATGTTVTHTYGEPGEYTVTVTAVDVAGNAASNETTVTVGSGSDGNDGDSGDSGNQDENDGDNDSGNQGDGGDSTDPDNGDNSADPDDGNTADPDDGGDDNDAPSGGGGGVPPADDDSDSALDTDLGDDSPTVAVNETDAGARVDVSAASGDEPVRAPLDGGPLQSVSITPSGDGSASLVVNRSVDAEAPNGTDAVLAAAGSGNATGVAALEYDFALSASDLSDRGVDADDLTTARLTDGGWESIPATVERDGDEVRVNASVDDPAPVVLAAPAPSLTAADVDVGGDAVVGEPVPVDVTLANEGHANGTGSLRLVADGRAVDSRDVTLAPGERSTVEMTARFSESGERSVSVAGEQVTVDVAANEPDVELASVSVANDTVPAGEDVEITATYVNRGHAAGNATANVTAFGELVAEKHVEVGAGERRNVTVTQSFDAPGTYEVAVDGEQRTVEVVASDAATETPTATEADADADVGGGTPTLVAGGVVLLLVTAAVASRAMG